MILLTSVFMAAIFSSCDKTEALEAKPTPITSEQPSSANGEEYTIIQAEITDLEKKDPSAFSTSSTNYSIKAISYQSVEGRLELDIRVSQPKVYMKNVVISGILPNNAYEVLYAPDLLITNVMMKDSFSDKEVSAQYTISPTIESPGGISTGRSFNLYPDGTFDNAIAKLKEINIKVSWIDENNKEQAEYIKTKILNELP
jgi:hypothetical protein